jgi:hypothetical protein
VRASSVSNSSSDPPAFTPNGAGELETSLGAILSGRAQGTLVDEELGGDAGYSHSGVVSFEAPRRVPRCRCWSPTSFVLVCERGEGGHLDGGGRARVSHAGQNERVFHSCPARHSRHALALGLVSWSLRP